MVVYPKELMTPKVKENKAFANRFRDWIAVGPKLRAASGRHIA